MSWSKAKRDSKASFGAIHAAPATPGAGKYHIDDAYSIHNSIKGKSWGGNARGGVFSLGRPIRPQTSRDRRAVNGVDVTKVPQKDKVEGEKGPGPAKYHTSRSYTKTRPSTARFSMRARPRKDSYHCLEPEGRWKRAPCSSSYHTGDKGGFPGFIKRSPSFSIRPCHCCKEGIPHDSCLVDIVPGPTAYGVEGLSPSGGYGLAVRFSPHSKEGTGHWSMRHKLRSTPTSRLCGGNVEWPGADTPGPGEYPVK